MSESVSGAFGNERQLWQGDESDLKGREGRWRMPKEIGREESAGSRRVG